LYQLIQLITVTDCHCYKFIAVLHWKIS